MRTGQSTPSTAAARPNPRPSPSWLSAAAAAAARSGSIRPAKPASTPTGSTTMSAGESVVEQRQLACCNRHSTAAGADAQAPTRDRRRCSHAPARLLPPPPKIAKKTGADSATPALANTRPTPEVLETWRNADVSLFLLRSFRGERETDPLVCAAAAARSLTPPAPLSLHTHPSIAPRPPSLDDPPDALQAVCFDVDSTL